MFLLYSFWLCFVVAYGIMPFLRRLAPTRIMSRDIAFEIRMSSDVTKIVQSFPRIELGSLQACRASTHLSYLSALTYRSFSLFSLP